MAFMLLALQVRRSWALWSSCGGRRVRLHRGMIHRAEDIRYTGGPLAEERSETKFEALRLRAVVRVFSQTIANFSACADGRCGGATSSLFSRGEQVDATGEGNDCRAASYSARR